MDKNIKGVNMNESIIKIRNWLAAMPYKDSPGFTGEHVTITWDEWIEQGRGIANGEQALIWMLTYEDNEIMRSHAAMALGIIGSKNSVDPLVNSLVSDNALVQMEAAASLGRVASPKAVDALCNAIKSDDSNVRANVCIALGKIGGIKAKEYLKRALSDDDPFVQEAAREGLK